MVPNKLQQEEVLYFHVINAQMIRFAHLGLKGLHVRKKYADRDQ